MLLDPVVFERPASRPIATFLEPVFVQFDNAYIPIAILQQPPPEVEPIEILSPLLPNRYPAECPIDTFPFLVLRYPAHLPIAMLSCEAELHLPALYPRLMLSLPTVKQYDACVPTIKFLAPLVTYLPALAPKNVF